MHFGMKMYNDQRNAQVFNLFINLFLPYMFWAFFQAIFRGSCTPASEDGLKESPKHVRQK
jgi:hypothetical protein